MLAFPIDSVVGTILYYGTDLEEALISTSGLYSDLLRDFAFIAQTASETTLSENGRTAAYEKLLALLQKYPDYFSQKQLSKSETNRMIILRMALRGALFTLKNINPDNSSYNPTNWAQLADDLQFLGYKRRLLAELGLIIEDNNQLTIEQLKVIHTYLTAIDRNSWQIGLLTFYDFLLGDVPVQPVNDYIFGRSDALAIGLGVIEYTSPLQSEISLSAAETSGFLVDLAHNISYNSLDSSRAGRYRDYGKYYKDRKKALLNHVAGPYVVFGESNINFELTKRKFFNAKFWDGDPDTWGIAWSNFWFYENKKRNFPRNDLEWLLSTPQAAFTTLAKLFVTNSYHFIKLAKLRYDRGLAGNIDAFLLYVDYHSRGRDSMSFFISDKDAKLDIRQVKVLRNRQGFVNGLDFNNRYRINFQIDENGWIQNFGWVQGFEIPTYEQMTAKP